MKWYSVDEFLPGKATGYVIARVLNSDYCQFIYQAIYTNKNWEFWDEMYFPGERMNEIKVTHWAHMPELKD